MSNPQVTVIIPTYDRADILPRAIESVLKQSLEDFELLIIDDGSADATSQVVANFQDSRIRYIFQPNQGISGAMNTGLSEARGEYIARLDSDDLWLPNMLQDLTGALETDRAFGVVYARARAMDASGAPLDEYRGLPPWYPGNAFTSMLYSDVTCNVAIVARRGCFEKAGHYDPSFAVHEDWDMWLRVARLFPFCFVDRVVAFYRYHPGNTTGPESAKYTSNIDERIRVLEKAYSEQNLSESAMDIKPLAYANAYIWMGADWWEKGCYGNALTRFRKAWQARRYSISAFFEISWGVIGRLYLWKSKRGQKLILKVRKLKNGSDR